MAFTRIEFAVKDDADIERPPVRFVVQESSYGLCITALNDAGESMGEAALEFFDNSINAHVYGPDDDGPSYSEVLTSDVSTARTEKPDEAERTDEA